MSEMTDQEKQLVEWLADMNEDDGLALAKRMLLEENADPMRVLALCRIAMDIVGKRFAEGEYFLPELVLAGEMLETVGAIAKPLIKQGAGGEPKRFARVLIGTVHGDLHDIGKNIVTFMLDINGFEVKDIGVDVPVATFLDEIDDFKPDVLGLSGFLTLAFNSMKETIDAIARRRPARQHEDHDRRRPDRRNGARLHRRGRVRHQRGRRRDPVQGLGGGRRMNAPQAYTQTPEAKAAYDARWQRVMDCVALRQPDRMPTTMMATFWLARYGGISYRQLMYDYEKTKEIAERAILEFEPDAPQPDRARHRQRAIAGGGRLQAIAVAGAWRARRPALPVSRPRIHEGGRV